MRRRPIPEMLTLLDEALAQKPVATAATVREIDDLLRQTRRIWR